MSRNLLDLANYMENLSKKIEDNANTLAKNTSKEVLTYFATHTRVDTSRALSNWQINTGSPETSRLKEGYYKGKHGSTQGPSSKMAIEVGTIQLRLKQPGESVYISNDVIDPDFGEHYIRKITDSENTVGSAIIAGMIYLRNTKLKLV